MGVRHSEVEILLIRPGVRLWRTSVDVEILSIVGEPELHIEIARIRITVGETIFGPSGVELFFYVGQCASFFRSPRFVSLKKQTFTHSHNELSHIILGQWFTHCECAQPSERRHPHIVGCPRGALLNALALLTCKSFRRLTFWDTFDQMPCRCVTVTV